MLAVLFHFDTNDLFSGGRLAAAVGEVRGGDLLEVVDVVDEAAFDLVHFGVDVTRDGDVDPKMNQVEGCFVYDIDDLQQVAAAHLADRSRESAAAEKIVSVEVEKYREHLQTREAVPAIVALQQNAESLRQAELVRIASKLAASGASLTPAQQAAVDLLTRSLTAKLLHPQIVDLRKKSG